MPEICRFYGIIIAMFYDEHNPPHFHARYGDYKVSVDIRSLSILEGKLPTRALYGNRVGKPTPERASQELGTN